jgi:hypothetical protein
MCRPHYIDGERERLGITPIPKVGTRDRMINRFWANVDQGPGCWEWQGGTIKGYGRLSQKGETVYAHRVSYELANGPIGEGLFIDHLCHNPGCVNPEHLRAVTPKQNTEHRAGGKPDSTSGGVHGVHWSKSAKKWHATVHAGDKVHHAGYFTDLDEAAEAARPKRNELFTHNDRDRRAS